MSRLRPGAALALVIGLLGLPQGAALAQRSATSAAPAPVRSIGLGLGMQEMLEIGRGVTRVAVGNPQVADVSLVGGRQLRILGLGAGETDIHIWRGQARSRMVVSVGQGLEGARAAAAKDPALAGVQVGSEAGRVVLRGTVPSLEAHQRLVSLARPERGELVDLTRITADLVVAVEVKFAAVQATRLQQLGFNFRALGTSTQGALVAPGSIANNGLVGGNGYVNPNQSPTANLGTLAASAAGLASPMSSAFNLLVGSNTNNILAAISMLASTNFAQLLAEPVLLVRSGEQASFLAGGEIPVPTPIVGAGFTTVTIDYKPFGVRLDVAATVMSDGRILLRVTPEVSELDYSNAITLQGFSIPAFRKRSATTTVELASGQSFMLAGMTFSNTSNLADRLPGLGQLPVLGPLFSRTSASRDMQELVIIATPRLVRPLEAARLPAGLATRAPLPSSLDIALQRNTAEQAANQFGLMR